MKNETKEYIVKGIKGVIYAVLIFLGGKKARDYFKNKNNG